MSEENSTNQQKFRALLGWLHYSERAAALELGVSTTLLRGIVNGTATPDHATANRILVMSRRWPYGLIAVNGWPEPLQDRRKKSAKGSK
jgi:hypothetical protein